jgi:hypothetical protein
MARMSHGGIARGLVGVLVLAGANFFPAAAQTEDERPCRADYQIRARYDETQRRISGEETIRWVNESRDDVPDLWFHLYWNAFANDRTTHLQPTGAGTREVKDGEWGWTRITSLVIGSEELVSKIEHVSPDDKRPEDRTVCRVMMPRIAKHGEAVVMTVKWEAQVPRVRRRTGWKDDFLFIAHWFPKLGVYETGNGWNCHQFHPTTEFFADYGTYDVELDVPAAYEGHIGASGVQSEPSRAGEGRVKLRFAAPSERDRVSIDRTGRTPLVHDFAWTGDPGNVKYQDTFHYDEWAEKYADEVDRVALALGRTRAEMRLRDVAVTVLLQPEREHLGKRHFEATCTALFFYGLWFGEYPYEHVTCVDPAWGGGAAGGMEYPTLFTAGTRRNTMRGMLEPESVTVHECGHQFWYGLVGNNEFESAWLDEGFNTYTQNEALAKHYGSRFGTTDFSGHPFDGVPLAATPGGGAIAEWITGRRWRLPRSITLEPLRTSGFLDWWRDQPMMSYGRQRTDPRHTDRIGYLSDPDTDPVDKAAYLYCDRQSYRTNSYRRTATALRSLAGLVGDDKFLRGMRSYAERWRYRHPYPEDFFDAFQEGAGVDVAWYFEQAFRSTATLDWRVDVAQKVLSDPRGWFPAADGQWVERDRRAKDDEGAQLRNGNGDGGGKGDNRGKEWIVDVVVKRRGDLLLPLTIELTWADGTQEQMTWTRDEQTRSAWWKPLDRRAPSKQKLVSAVIDPERRYTFDLDLSDNQWFDAVDQAAPLRWSERVFEQYTSLLHFWGGIGG